MAHVIWPQTRLTRIGDETGVGEARRLAARMARELGLDVDTTGRLAIVVSELGRNMWKHAGGGELLLRALDDGVEVLALDKGAGIADVGRALDDGFSTRGTAGTGLGAARRQSQAFEIWSAPGGGVAAVARVRGGKESAVRAGAVCLPKPGEEISGDGWMLVERGGRILAAVSDGLGHGPDAAAASRAALAELSRRAGEAPPALLTRLHEPLRGTRGAAVAVCAIDLEAGTLAWSGLGNVGGFIVRGERQTGLVSAHGTVGADLRKPTDQREPFGAEDTLIMASDGVRPRWQWSSYPGLLWRDPALVAGVLYRDFANGRDDATVLVVRAGG